MKGTEFLAEFKEFAVKEYIDLIKSTPYVKKENGLGERAIRTVQSVYRVITKENPKLGLQIRLSLAELYINHTPKTRTSFTPLEIMTLQGSTLDNKELFFSEDIRSQVQKVLYKQKEAQETKKNKV